MPIAADYPFLDIVWTMIIFFTWVVWVWMMILILSDVFRRRDISGWRKASWVVLLIVLPFIGVLAYLIAQHDAMAERAHAGSAGRQGRARTATSRRPPPRRAGGRDRQGHPPAGRGRHQPDRVRGDQGQGTRLRDKGGSRCPTHARPRPSGNEHEVGALRRVFDETGGGWILFAGIMLMLVGVLECDLRDRGDRRLELLHPDTSTSSATSTPGAGDADPRRGADARGLLDLGRQPVRPLVRHRRGRAERDRRAVSIPAYPFWSLAIFAVDILIIYGLSAYGGQHRPL